MAWKPKTVLGKVLKGAVKTAGTMASTAFPVSGSVVTRAAAAFKAGVQTDTKNLAKTKASIGKVIDGGAGKDFNKLVAWERFKQWIGANIVLIGFVLSGIVLAFVFLSKKRVSKHRKSARRTIPRSVGMRKAKPEKKTTSGGGEFRRKIRGKVYTSRKAWAEEMQRLRRKKS